MRGDLILVFLELYIRRYQGKHFKCNIITLLVLIYRRGGIHLRKRFAISLMRLLVRGLEVYGVYLRTWSSKKTLTTLVGFSGTTGLTT